MYKQTALLCKTCAIYINELGIVSPQSLNLILVKLKDIMLGTNSIFCTQIVKGRLWIKDSYPQVCFKTAVWIYLVSG